MRYETPVMDSLTSHSLDATASSLALLLIRALPVQPIISMIPVGPQYG